MNSTDVPPPAPQAAQTPPPPPPHSGPRVSHAQMRDVNRLRRSTADRKLAGVAAGIARQLDVDPTLVRVVLAVSALFGGAGLLVYAAGWLLIPDDVPGAQAIVRLEPQVLGGVVFGVLIVAGVMMVGGSWQFGVLPWPLLVVALVVLVVVLSRRQSANLPPESATWPGPEPVSLDKAPAGPAPWGPAPPPGDPAARRRALAAQVRQRRAEARRARKRAAGPSLFLPTLALVAIACGALWLVSEARGYDVPDAGYPALALGVIGAMLVVGAFFGRTLGVFFLALCAGLAMGLATLVTAVSADETVRPVDAASVTSSYDAGVGRFRLDLSDVRDPEALAGRAVSVEGSLGVIEVTVPRGLDVRASATAEAGGEVVVFGDRVDGDSPSLTRRIGQRSGEPVLTLDVDLTAGRIVIEEES